MNDFRKKTVAIVGDHPLILRGIQATLSSSAEFRIIAVCADGATALRELKEKNPDLAILDMDTPALRAVDVLHKVFSHKLRTRVILITGTISDAAIVGAFELGAYGILSKVSVPDSTIEALRVVAAGRRWLSQELLANPARESEHLGMARSS